MSRMRSSRYDDFRAEVGATRASFRVYPSGRTLARIQGNLLQREFQDRGLSRGRWDVGERLRKLEGGGETIKWHSTSHRNFSFAQATSFGIHGSLSILLGLCPDSPLDRWRFVRRAAKSMLFSFLTPRPAREKVVINSRRGGQASDSNENAFDPFARRLLNYFFRSDSPFFSLIRNAKAPTADRKSSRNNSTRPLSTPPPPRSTE